MEDEGKRARASLYIQATGGSDTSIHAPPRGDEDTSVAAALSAFLSNKRRRQTTKPTTQSVEQTEASPRATESLTEMEKQVVALKTKYPGVLLLFECGYRMRMFGDDAEHASHVLGIRAERHRTFMEASVPVHRALHHGRRLVSAGFKIGIVKQLSSVSVTPRQPLERDVVEVYTRATIPDADDDAFSGASDGSGMFCGDGSEQAESGQSAGIDRDMTNTTMTEDGTDMTLGQPRLILALVEETVQSTKLFTKAVHTMDAQLRAATDFEDVRIGVFGYDIHTGNSVFDEFKDGGKRSRLIECLSLIRPVEFLLPIGGVSPQTEQILSNYSRQDRVIIDGKFQSVCRIEHIKFCDTLMKSVVSLPAANGSYSDNPTLSRLPQCCLIAMREYLRSLKFDIALSIDTIRDSKESIRQATDRMMLSQFTQRDLAIVNERPLRALSDDDGSLFSLMNHTRTIFGARLLREWFRSPLTSSREIEERQDCVEFLSCVPGDGSVWYEALRDDILPAAAPTERLLQQLHLRRATPSSVVRLLKALIRVEKHIFEAFELTTSTSVVHELLHRHPRSLTTLETILNSLNTDAAQRNETEQAISLLWMKHYPEKRELEDVIRDLRAIEQDFHEILVSYRRELKMPRLEYSSHRASGFGKTSDHLIAVDREALVNIPSDWFVVSSTKAVVRFYAPQVRALQVQEDLLAEKRAHLVGSVWLKVLTAIDSDIYVVGMRSVDVLAELDCLMSMATSVRLHPNYVRPRFTTTRKLSIESGRHPTLELLASQGSSYISGTIGLGSDNAHGSAMIISGPNMGGKSTMLRMVALLVVMAQVGSFVPAAAMSLSPFDAIHSRMHRTPEITAPRSHGPGDDELRQLSELVKSATSKSLVLLDEVGFGLTTQQANALAVSVLKYLVQKMCCRVLLATHTAHIVQRLFDEGFPQDQIQAKELAHEISSSQTRDSMVNQSLGVVYHYTTRDGFARSSFALHAASLGGLPKHIIDRAAEEAELPMSEEDRARENIETTRHPTQFIIRRFEQEQPCQHPSEPPRDNVLEWGRGNLPDGIGS